MRSSLTRSSTIASTTAGARLTSFAGGGDSGTSASSPKRANPVSRSRASRSSRNRSRVVSSPRRSCSTSNNRDWKLWLSSFSSNTSRRRTTSASSSSRSNRARRCAFSPSMTVMIRSRISPAMARVRCLSARSACSTACAASRSSAAVASRPSSDPSGCSTPLESCTATGPSSQGGSGSSSAGPVRIAVVETLPNGCGSLAVTPAATPNWNSTPSSLAVTPTSRSTPSGSDRRRARENPRPAAVMATPI